MKQRQMLKTGCTHEMDSSQADLFNGKVDMSDESEGIIPMQRLRPNENKQFIEAQILDGDTLQALALKFRCTVSELKRVNHIDKENEIHARRTLKVPITPFSVLTEAFAEVRSSNAALMFHSNLSAEIAAPVDSLVNTMQNSLESQLKSEDVLQTTVNFNNVIMNSVISSTGPKFTDEEEMENGRLSDDLNSPLLRPALQANKSSTLESVVIKEFTSQGADFGLKWIHLLICIIVLGFVIPLVYVFYIAEKHHHIIDEHLQHHLQKH